MSDVLPVIDHFEAVAPDRIRQTTRDGRNVFAFEVRPGDVQEWDRGNIYANSGLANERAELSYAPGFTGDWHKSPYKADANTGVRSYRIGIGFDPIFPADQAWASLFQFHPDAASGYGPADAGNFGGFFIHGNKLEVAMPNGFVPLGVADSHHWYELRADVKWSAGPDGYVRVYEADKLVANYSGVTAASGKFYVPKQGYYRAGGTQGIGIVYETQLVISTPDVSAPPPVVLPPAPATPPAVPAGLGAKAQAGLDLLVALRVQLQKEVTAAQALAAASTTAATELQKLDDRIKALLDQGPWA